MPDPVVKDDGSSFLKLLPTHEVMITKPYVEVEFPYNYIEHGIAEIIGNEIETFGLFKIKVYDSYDYDPAKPDAIYFFNFPSKIRTCPSVIDESTRSNDGEKLIVLKYEENDFFIKSVYVKEDNEVAKQMVNIMFNAYLPDSIPYNEITSFWTKVNRFNGVKPATCEAVLEIMVSVMARDPNDFSRPFRYLLRDSGKQTVDMYSRKLISMRNIPKYNSTFASLTAGDPKQGITSSISRIRSGKRDKETPIEIAIE